MLEGRPSYYKTHAVLVPTPLHDRLVIAPVLRVADDRYLTVLDFSSWVLRTKKSSVAPSAYTSYRKASYRKASSVCAVDGRVKIPSVFTGGNVLPTKETPRHFVLVSMAT